MTHIPTRRHPRRRGRPPRRAPERPSLRLGRAAARRGAPRPAGLGAAPARVDGPGRRRPPAKAGSRCSRSPDQRGACLPPIAQPGARPVVGRQGGALVQVDAKAKASGGEVTLQIRRDGDWADAGHATARQGRSRHVRVPAGRAAPGPMRVVPAPTGVRSDPHVLSKSWKLGFDDEFTGDALDQAKWSYRQLGRAQPRAHQVGELARRRRASRTARCS